MPYIDNTVDPERNAKMVRSRRASGEDVPALVRIVELVVGPSTRPDRTTKNVLRFTALFSDGEYRSMSWLLDELEGDLALHDDCIVTDQWLEATRGYRGTVDGANPPRDTSPTAAPKAAPAGISKEFLGSVLTPLVGKMGEANRETKTELENAKLRIVALETELAERRKEGAAHRRHLHNLEERLRKMGREP